VAETQHNFLALRIDNGSNVLKFWKPIKGYEGLYEISNHGEVKSLMHRKLMSASAASNGYLMTTLSNSGTKKTFCIHSLVASHFLNNPLRKPIINHRNAIKTDNYVGNLEWATYSENIKHAYANKLRKAPSSGKFGKDHHKSKPVLQFTKAGVFINEFASMSDAARELGIRVMGIQGVCSGADKSYKGFIWKFK
jgi:hypothetical protein